MKLKTKSLKLSPMKIGICEWELPVTGLEARFEWAARAGLAALEIDLENAEANEARIRTLSNHWNIHVPTLGINACCKHSMCRPADAAIIRTAFEAAVKTATALGIEKLQVPSFCESHIHTEEDFLHTVEHYRFLCRLARGTGLIIGTENALAADKQLELLDRVGSDQLRIYFDTRNAFAMSRLNSAEILEQLYPHVCEVHLKDGTDDGPAQPLGHGNSGFFQCLEILRQKKYSRWMLLENKYTDIENCKTDIQTVSEYLRRET